MPPPCQSHAAEQVSMLPAQKTMYGCTCCHDMLPDAQQPTWCSKNPGHYLRQATARHPTKKQQRKDHCCWLLLPSHTEE